MESSLDSRRSRYHRLKQETVHIKQHGSKTAQSKDCGKARQEIQLHQLTQLMLARPNAKQHGGFYMVEDTDHDELAAPGDRRTIVWRLSGPLEPSSRPHVMKIYDDVACESEMFTPTM
jgi:hypothetical protein